nr:hypothetical protein [uncultured Bacteroides sp.]
MKRLIILLGALCFLVSCNEEERTSYDYPFVYIASESGASKAVVGSNVNNINTYSVYLSSKPLAENVEVFYEMVVGNGLKQGVDFELVTKGASLVFLPGIYDMPIRIRWKPNKVDESKDNTITIRLLGNSLDLTLGLPGPDGLQKELVIEKKN